MLEESCQTLQVERMTTMTKTLRASGSGTTTSAQRTSSTTCTMRTSACSATSGLWCLPPRRGNAGCRTTKWALNCPDSTTLLQERMLYDCCCTTLCVAYFRRRTTLMKYAHCRCNSQPLWCYLRCLAFYNKAMISSTFPNFDHAFSWKVVAIILLPKRLLATARKQCRHTP